MTTLVLCWLYRFRGISVLSLSWRMNGLSTFTLVATSLRTRNSDTSSSSTPSALTKLEYSTYVEGSSLRITRVLCAYVPMEVTPLSGSKENVGSHTSLFTWYSTLCPKRFAGAW